MLVPKNEGKACDAVVRWLEERTGNTRASVCVPEKCKIGPPVELRLFLGSQEFAFEHTLTEPFSDYFKTGKTFLEIAEPIERAVSGKLPGPAIFLLRVPTNPYIKRSDIESFRGNIIKMIFDQAPTLYQRATASNVIGKNVVYTPNEAGFPYNIEFSCSILRGNSDGEEPGIFKMISKEPSDLQKKRKDRLRIALDAKYGKLKNCNDTRTILVLEDNDIALSNPVDIAQSLQRILVEGRYEIDEIFIVDTKTTSWYLWPIKCGMNFLRLDYTVLNPVDLNDITSGKCPRHQLSPSP